jgi:hypothetical protein
VRSSLAFGQLVVIWRPWTTFWNTSNASVEKDRVGAGRYVASPSLKRLASCWTHWNGVRPFDLSWKNLYGPGPRLLGFVLNSLINSVRTPDMLFL